MSSLFHSPITTSLQWLRLARATSEKANEPCKSLHCEDVYGLFRGFQYIFFYGGRGLGPLDNNAPPKHVQHRKDDGTAKHVIVSAVRTWEKVPGVRGNCWKNCRAKRRFRTFPHHSFSEEHLEGRFHKTVLRLPFERTYLDILGPVGAQPRNDRNIILLNTEKNIPVFPKTRHPRTSTDVRQGDPHITTLLA